MLKIEPEIQMVGICQWDTKYGRTIPDKIKSLIFKKYKDMIKGCTLAEQYVDWEKYFIEEQRLSEKRLQRAAAIDSDVSSAEKKPTLWWLISVENKNTRILWLLDIVAKVESFVQKMELVYALDIRE